MCLDPVAGAHSDRPRLSISRYQPPSRAKQSVHRERLQRASTLPVSFMHARYCQRKPDDVHEDYIEPCEDYRILPLESALFYRLCEHDVIFAPNITSSANHVIVYSSFPESNYYQNHPEDGDAV